jgi:hypothetical protein
MYHYQTIRPFSLALSASSRERSSVVSPGHWRFRKGFSVALTPLLDPSPSPLRTRLTSPACTGFSSISALSPWILPPIHVPRSWPAQRQIHSSSAKVYQHVVKFLYLGPGPTCCPQLREAPLVWISKLTQLHPRYQLCRKPPGLPLMASSPRWLASPLQFASVAPAKTQAPNDPVPTTVKA